MPALKRRVERVARGIHLLCHRIGVDETFKTNKGQIHFRARVCCCHRQWPWWQAMMWQRQSPYWQAYWHGCCGNRPSNGPGWYSECHKRGWTKERYKYRLWWLWIWNLAQTAKHAKRKPLVVYRRDRSLSYKLVRCRLPVNTTLPLTKEYNMVLSQMQNALFCHRDPSSQLS